MHYHSTTALMHRAGALLACSGALLGCQGIEDEADGVGGQGEPTGSTSQALACGDITSHTLPSGFELTPLLDYDTHFCWLSEFVNPQTGDHRPRGNMIHQQGNYWLYTAHGTRVSAYCIPQSCFFANNPGSVTWVSDRWEYWLVQAVGGFNQRLIWNGDTAAVLQGIGGTSNSNFWGAVWQNSSSTTPSSVVVNNPSLDGSLAVASGLFVGVPGGSHHPKIRSMTTLTKRNGCAIKHMIPVDEGICYFTYLGGDFWGTWESARIVTTWNPLLAKDQWGLEVCAGSAPTISAQAVCYDYNQTN